MIAVLCLSAYLQTQPPQRVAIERKSLEKIFQSYGVKRLSVLTARGLQYLEKPGTIETGAILAVKLNELPRIIKTEAALEVVLPYRFGVLQQAGVLPLGLVMVVLIQGGAIEYHPDQHRYLGSLLVGARNEQNPDLVQALQGVMAQLIIDQGKADPDLIPIETTGLPFKNVTTEATSIKGNEVGLQIIPSFSPDDPLSLSVPVRRPEITILASPSRVQGFGLQACRLTVSTKGAYANAIKKLTLRTTRGKLNPEVVEIDTDMGTGMTTLYSSGLGISEVSVSSGDLSTSQTVHFVFPFAFIISALIGAIMGGIIKGHRSIKKVVVGILIGFVISIGVVFGINLLEINVVNIYASRGFSEALLILIAALGAFGGRLIIESKSQPNGN